MRGMRWTEAAGLSGLRFHDLRHQVYTELKRPGSPRGDHRLIGHVSDKMRRVYSHTRLDSKRTAVELLGSRL